MKNRREMKLFIKFIFILSVLHFGSALISHPQFRLPAGGVSLNRIPDYNPSINSETALLAAVDAKLQADAANPLIVGYWISDDWNLWDAGSARTVLQDIHTHILQHTPRRPAICGFGVDVMPPGVSAWDPRISLNY